VTIDIASAAKRSFPKGIELRPFFSPDDANAVKLNVENKLGKDQFEQHMDPARDAVFRCMAIRKF
jgi:hypothetical protein